MSDSLILSPLFFSSAVNVGRFCLNSMRLEIVLHHLVRNNALTLLFAGGDGYGGAGCWAGGGGGGYSIISKRTAKGNQALLVAAGGGGGASLDGLVSMFLCFAASFQLFSLTC